jgi:MFS family permease
MARQAANESETAPTDARRCGAGELLVISCMWLAYNLQWGALLFVVLPRQVEAIAGPLHKEFANGAVFAIGAATSLIITPIAGALSDRSRHPWGRRRPFLVVGALINIVFLLAMAGFGEGSSIWLFALCFAGIQFGCNWWGGPYAGLIPDVVPKDVVGRASGMQALMNAAGLLVGALAAGELLNRVPRAYGYWPIYLMIAGVLAATLLVTVIGVREKPNTEPAPAGGEKGLFKDFFLDPEEHANFYWVLATRAMQCMGVYAIVPNFQYFLHDVIKVGSTLPAAESANAAAGMAAYVVGTLTVVGIPTSIIAGALSDRHGRKPLVYLSGGLMAAAAIVFIFAGLAQSLTFVFCVAVAYGIGNGAYTAVDWALALDVLPSKEDAAAKDMGIWHVSLVLPQIVGPLIAGVMLGTIKQYSHMLAYTAVFGVAAVWFILATVFVRKIRGVR